MRGEQSIVFGISLIQFLISEFRIYHEAHIFSFASIEQIFKYVWLAVIIGGFSDSATYIFFCFLRRNLFPSCSSSTALGYFFPGTNFFRDCL